VANDQLTARRRSASGRSTVIAARVCDGGPQMDEVRTEADGLGVTWRVLQDHLISIVAVHSASDPAPIVSFGPDAYPDLVQARELLPELTRLWDAVRHDFWAKLIPPPPGSSRSRRWA
jgi:hypothetical protein